MANSAQNDMRRAADYRAMAKKAKDPEAKSQFEATAARLERNAARKANKVGRKKRKKTTL